MIKTVIAALLATAIALPAFAQAVSSNEANAKGSDRTGAEQKTPSRSR